MGIIDLAKQEYWGGHSSTFIIQPSNSVYGAYWVEFHPISLNIGELDYGRNYGWKDSKTSGNIIFASNKIKKIINITAQINPFTTYLNKKLEGWFENSVLPENAIKALDIMATGGLSFIMSDEEGRDVLNEATWNNGYLEYTQFVIKTLNTKSSHFSQGLETKAVKFTMQIEILQFKRREGAEYLKDYSRYALNDLLGFPAYE